jgi:hypothetical protein
MAAQAGTIYFEAADNGELFSVDAYVPDAVATNLTFSTTGLAASTSTAYWAAPEDCYLVDISGAAPTAVGGVILFDGSPVKNHTFRWANQLATLATRPKQRLFIPAGTQVGVLQY